MNGGVLAACAAVAVLSFGLGWFLNRWRSRRRASGIEEQAGKLLAAAQKEAEATKREAALEAKDEWYRAKESFEQETQAKRVEVQRLERKLSERDANLNRRADLLEKKERENKQRHSRMGQREQELAEEKRRLDERKRELSVRLEQLAGYTAEEAKQTLMAEMEAEARQEAARTVRDIRERAQRDAEREARGIITLAIQRLAAERVAETTVSVVSLPNEEMKGRIIGREGRNIRAFETATGIDVIIDDTPEAVILSGFEPVRREIARVALERLVADGRIHPARIEEIVAQARSEIEEQIVAAGEQACLDVGIVGLHPELVRHMGRMKFRTSYGQNVLRHSMEVAYLCGMMAAELGVDADVARRAGFLHDIGKSVDHEVPGTHTEIGAEIARRFGEPEEVVEAILHHHDDPSPDRLYAVLVQAADAISGARPGARRERLEAYIKRLQKLEQIASSFEGVAKSFALQAGREIRIMVESRKVNDDQARELASLIARRVERDLEYPGQVKVVVIRETRNVEYAK
jgi:ribonuclease Y